MSMSRLSHPTMPRRFDFNTAREIADVAVTLDNNSNVALSPASDGDDDDEHSKAVKQYNDDVDEYCESAPRDIFASSLIDGNDDDDEDGPMVIRFRPDVYVALFDDGGNYCDDADV